MLSNNLHIYIYIIWLRSKALTDKELPHELDNCGIFKQLYNLSWQLLQIVAHTLYVIYEAWNCLLNLLH